MYVYCAVYIQQQDQRVESAAYVWDLIQNCLDILGISESEALGLWSLLAAIYHLGYAGVKKSKPPSIDTRFFYTVGNRSIVSHECM